MYIFFVEIKIIKLLMGNLIAATMKTNMENNSKIMIEN
jgi:hypothetical protein